MVNSTLVNIVAMWASDKGFFILFYTVNTFIVLSENVCILSLMHSSEMSSGGPAGGEAVASPPAGTCATCCTCGQ